MSTSSSTLAPSPDDQRPGSDAGFTSFLLRHPVACVFASALTVRIIVALGVTLFFDGFLFSDDVTYHQMATEVVSGLDWRWDAYTHYLFDTTATFLYPLTALYTIAGPNVFLAQIFVALMGAGAAALLTLLAAEWMPKRWAMMAGFIVAFLPSQVLWSSLVLKDAQVWFLLTALALAVVMSARLSSRRLAAAGLSATLCLLGLAFLREHTMVMAAWALIAACLAPASRRGARLAGGIVIALTVPWVAGYGPVGLDLALHPGSLQERRLANARGADSAFVAPEPPDDTGETPPGGQTGTGTGQPVAPSPPEEAPLAADVRHLPRGIAYLLFAPFPWVSGANTGVDLARLEAVVWYPILVLAVIGLVGQLRDRRGRHLIIFPALAGVGSLIIYALTEGNVGTAYRHRGEFVWAVVLFAAIALERLHARTTSGSND